MRSSNIRAFRILIASILGLSAMPLHLLAQRLNYEIVSTYVYNFTKYIEWPSDSKKNQFVVAVYGKSDVTAVLTKFMSSKHVGSKSMIVKDINSPQDATGTDVLFVPHEQSAKLKELSEQLKGKPVLLITERYGYSKKGAAISIYLDEDDDNKTKFEINKNSLVENRLIVSANLLKLAAEVH